MSDKKHIIFISTKCNFSTSLLNLMNEEMKNMFEIVDVMKTRVPPNIQSVPTILVDKHQIKAGRQAFDFIQEEKKLYLNAFESGFGTNGFSYIESENSLCENTQPFTFLTQDGFQTEPIASDQSSFSTKQQQKESQKSELEMLMEKRKQEIPQPISRK